MTTTPGGIPQKLAALEARHNAGDISPLEYEVTKAQLDKDLLAAKMLLLKAIIGACVVGLMFIGAFVLVVIAAG